MKNKVVIPEGGYWELYYGDIFASKEYQDIVKNNPYLHNEIFNTIAKHARIIEEFVMYDLYSDEGHTSNKIKDLPMEKIQVLIKDMLHDILEDLLQNHFNIEEYGSGLNDPMDMYDNLLYTHLGIITPKKLPELIDQMIKKDFRDQGKKETQR